MPRCPRHARDLFYSHQFVPFNLFTHFCTFPPSSSNHRSVSVSLAVFDFEDFIYSYGKMRERERQAPRREPDAELDPRIPGSRPEPKAGAQPEPPGRPWCHIPQVGEIVWYVSPLTYSLSTYAPRLLHDVTNGQSPSFSTPACPPLYPQTTFSSTHPPRGTQVVPYLGYLSLIHI